MSSEGFNINYQLALFIEFQLTFTTTSKMNKINLKAKISLIIVILPELCLFLLLTCSVLLATLPGSIL